MLLKKHVSNKGNWGCHYDVRKSIDKYEREVLKGETMTKEETLDFLFGNYDQYARTSLELILIKKPNRTMYHRFNFLWVWLLTLVLSPVRYLVYGDIGWSKETKVGRFLLKICGY